MRCVDESREQFENNLPYKCLLACLKFLSSTMAWQPHHSISLGSEVFPCLVLQIFGGLLIHQQRHQRDIRCNSHFAKISSRCRGAVTNMSHARQLVANSKGNPLHAFGADAAFLPSSVLFNADAVAHIADFYNLSVTAGQVSPEGFPFGFFSKSLSAFPPGFPVLFEVGLWFPHWRAIGKSKMSRKTIKGVGSAHATIECQSSTNAC
jgi:hypothetical protein